MEMRLLYVVNVMRMIKMDDEIIIVGEKNEKTR